MDTNSDRYGFDPQAQYDFVTSHEKYLARSPEERVDVINKLTGVIMDSVDQSDRGVMRDLTKRHAIERMKARVPAERIVDMGVEIMNRSMPKELMDPDFYDDVLMAHKGTNLVTFQGDGENKIRKGDLGEVNLGPGVEPIGIELMAHPFKNIVGIDTPNGRVLREFEYQRDIPSTGDAWANMVLDDPELREAFGARDLNAFQHMLDQPADAGKAILRGLSKGQSDLLLAFKTKAYDGIADAARSDDILQKYTVTDDGNLREMPQAMFDAIHNVAEQAAKEASSITGDLDSGFYSQGTHDSYNEAYNKTFREEHLKILRNQDPILAIPDSVSGDARVPAQFNVLRGSEKSVQPWDQVDRDVLMLANAGKFDENYAGPLADAYHEWKADADRVDEVLGDSQSKALERAQGGIIQGFRNIHTEASESTGRALPTIGFSFAGPVAAGVSGFTSAWTGHYAESFADIYQNNKSQGIPDHDALEKAIMGATEAANLAAPIDAAGDVIFAKPLSMLGDVMRAVGPVTRNKLSKIAAREISQLAGKPMPTIGRYIGGAASQFASEAAGELTRAETADEYKALPSGLKENVESALYEGFLSLVSAGQSYAVTATVQPVLQRMYAHRMERANMAATPYTENEYAGVRPGSKPSETRSTQSKAKEKANTKSEAKPKPSVNEEVREEVKSIPDPTPAVEEEVAGQNPIEDTVRWANPVNVPESESQALSDAGIELGGIYSIDGTPVMVQGYSVDNDGMVIAQTMDGEQAHIPVSHFGDFQQVAGAQEDVVTQAPTMSEIPSPGEVVGEGFEASQAPQATPTPEIDSNVSGVGTPNDSEPAVATGTLGHPSEESGLTFEFVQPVVSETGEEVSAVPLQVSSLEQNKAFEASINHGFQSPKTQAIQSAYGIPEGGGSLVDYLGTTYSGLGLENVPVSFRQHEQGSQFRAAYHSGMAGNELRESVVMSDSAGVLPLQSDLEHEARHALFRRTIQRAKSGDPDAQALIKKVYETAEVFEELYKDGKLDMLSPDALEYFKVGDTEAAMDEVIAQSIADPYVAQALGDVMLPRNIEPDGSVEQVEPKKNKIKFKGFLDRVWRGTVSTAQGDTNQGVKTDPTPSQSALTESALDLAWDLGEAIADENRMPQNNWGPVDRNFAWSLLNSVIQDQMDQVTTSIAEDSWVLPGAAKGDRRGYIVSARPGIAKSEAEAIRLGIKLYKHGIRDQETFTQLMGKARAGFNSDELFLSIQAQFHDALDVAGFHGFTDEQMREQVGEDFKNYSFDADEATFRKMVKKYQRSGVNVVKAMYKYSPMGQRGKQYFESQEQVSPSGIKFTRLGMSPQYTAALERHKTNSARWDDSSKAELSEAVRELQYLNTLSDQAYETRSKIRRSYVASMNKRFNLPKKHLTKLFYQTTRAGVTDSHREFFRNTLDTKAEADYAIAATEHFQKEFRRFMELDPKSIYENHWFGQRDGFGGKTFQQVMEGIYDESRTIGKKAAVDTSQLLSQSTEIWERVTGDPGITKNVTRKAVEEMVLQFDNNPLWNRPQERREVAAALYGEYDGFSFNLVGYNERLDLQKIETTAGNRIQENAIRGFVEETAIALARKEIDGDGSGLGNLLLSLAGKQAGGRDGGYTRIAGVTIPNGSDVYEAIIKPQVYAALSFYRRPTASGKSEIPVPVDEKFFKAVSILDQVIEDTRKRYNKLVNTSDDGLWNTKNLLKREVTSRALGNKMDPVGKFVIPSVMNKTRKTGTSANTVANRLMSSLRRPDWGAWDPQSDQDSRGLRPIAGNDTHGGGVAAATGSLDAEGRFNEFTQAEEIEAIKASRKRENILEYSTRYEKAQEREMKEAISMALGYLHEYNDAAYDTLAAASAMGNNTYEDIASTLLSMVEPHMSFHVDDSRQEAVGAIAQALGVDYNSAANILAASKAELAPLGSLMDLTNSASDDVLSNEGQAFMNENMRKFIGDVPMVVFDSKAIPPSLFDRAKISDLQGSARQAGSLTYVPLDTPSGVVNLVDVSKFNPRDANAEVTSSISPMHGVIASMVETMNNAGSLRPSDTKHVSGLKADLADIKKRLVALPSLTPKRAESKEMMDFGVYESIAYRLQGMEKYDNLRDMDDATLVSTILTDPEFRMIVGLIKKGTNARNISPETREIARQVSEMDRQSYAEAAYNRNYQMSQDSGVLYGNDGYASHDEDFDYDEVSDWYSDDQRDDIASMDEILGDSKGFQIGELMDLADLPSERYTLQEEEERFQVSRDQQTEWRDRFLDRFDRRISTNVVGIAFEYLQLAAKANSNGSQKSYGIEMDQSGPIVEYATIMPESDKRHDEAKIINEGGKRPKYSMDDEAWAARYAIDQGIMDGMLMVRAQKGRAFGEAHEKFLDDASNWTDNEGVTITPDMVVTEFRTRNARQAGNFLLGGRVQKISDPSQRRKAAESYAREFLKSKVDPALMQELKGKKLSEEFFTNSILLQMADLTDAALRPTSAPETPYKVMAYINEAFKVKMEVQPDGSTKEVGGTGWGRYQLPIMTHAWRRLKSGELAFTMAEETKGSLNASRVRRLHEDAVKFLHNDAIYRKMGAKSKGALNAIMDVASVMEHGVNGYGGFTGYRSKSYEIEKRFNELNKLLGRAAETAVPPTMIGHLTQYASNKRDSVKRTIEEIDKSIENLKHANSLKSTMKTQVRELGIYDKVWGQLKPIAEDYADGNMTRHQYETALYALLDDNQLKWLEGVREFFAEIKPAMQVVGSWLDDGIGEFENYFPMMNARLDGSSAAQDTLFRPLEDMSKVGISAPRQTKQRFNKDGPAYAANYNGIRMMTQAKTAIFAMMNAQSGLVLHDTFGTHQNNKEIEGTLNQLAYQGTDPERSKDLMAKHRAQLNLNTEQSDQLNAFAQMMRSVFDRERTGFQSGLSIDNTTRRTIQKMNQIGAFASLADPTQIYKQTVPGWGLFMARFGADKNLWAGLSSFWAPNIKEKNAALRALAPSVAMRGFEGNQELTKTMELELLHEGFIRNLPARASHAYFAIMGKALDWTTGKPDAALSRAIWVTKFAGLQKAAGLRGSAIWNDRSVESKKRAYQAQVYMEEIMGQSEITRRGQSFQSVGTSVTDEAVKSIWRAFGGHNTSMAGNISAYWSEFGEAQDAATKAAALYKITELLAQQATFRLLSQANVAWVAGLAAMAMGFDGKDVEEWLLEKNPLAPPTRKTEDALDFWNRYGYLYLVDAAVTLTGMPSVFSGVGSKALKAERLFNRIGGAHAVPFISAFPQAIYRTVNDEVVKKTTGDTPPRYQPGIMDYTFGNLGYMGVTVQRWHDNLKNGIHMALNIPEQEWEDYLNMLQMTIGFRGMAQRSSREAEDSREGKKKDSGPAW